MRSILNQNQQSRNSSPLTNSSPILFHLRRTNDPSRMDNLWFRASQRLDKAGNMVLKCLVVAPSQCSPDEIQPVLYRRDSLQCFAGRKPFRWCPQAVVPRRFPRL